MRYKPTLPKQDGLYLIPVIIASFRINFHIFCENGKNCINFFNFSIIFI